ncbi:hypothetical protein EV2_042817 [Malus domestica]
MFFCLHRISKTTPTGVMTFSFIQAIEYGHGTTNGDILSSMRSTTTRRMKKVILRHLAGTTATGNKKFKSKKKFSL